MGRHGRSASENMMIYIIDVMQRIARILIKTMTTAMNHILHTKTETIHILEKKVDKKTIIDCWTFSGKILVETTTSVTREIQCEKDLDMN